MRGGQVVTLAARFVQGIGGVVLAPASLTNATKPATGSVADRGDPPGVLAACAAEVFSVGYSLAFIACAALLLLAAVTAKTLLKPAHAEAEPKTSQRKGTIIR